MAIVDIILPKLGESVAEATILKWLKSVGDQVNRDDTLAEVATDKVETDLPSEYAGILHSVLVEEGEVVSVGAVIATMEVENLAETKVESDLTITEKKIRNNDSKRKSSESANQKLEFKNTADLFLTPVVRNIAAEAGLTSEDLLKIIPTGSNASRITKKDILNYLHPLPTKSLTPHDAKRELTVEPDDQVIQLSRIRKLIADHMSLSVKTAAHVTSWAEADVTEIVKWRDEHKARFKDEFGLKLTYTHLFIREVVKTLKAYPKLNAWLNGGEELIIKNKINLGFATATPDDNLIVPNLKNASSLTLMEIVRGVNELGGAAKTGKLKPSDIEETTFTISNTGVYGSLMGTPILSLPQVGILALGEIVSKPAVLEADGAETIAIRKLMYMSLSYDHRIIDGAYASGFLKSLKQNLGLV